MYFTWLHARPFDFIRGFFRACEMDSTNSYCPVIDLGIEEYLGEDIIPRFIVGMRSLGKSSQRTSSSSAISANGGPPLYTIG